MRCPTCKHETPADSPFVPFCSERCRMIDLGNWMSGRYVISTPLASAGSIPAPEDAEGKEGPSHEH
jgi:endogenous inhibitor of DNA gyrase (YacG/DUF329 family)